MNRKHIFSIRNHAHACCLLFILAQGSLAAGPGTSSGIILAMPIGARAAGLAEACVTMSGDPFGLYYNPAGLAFLPGREVSLLFQRGIIEDQFWALAAGYPLGSARLGGSFAYYTTGVIELTDVLGRPRNVKGQEDYVLTLCASREIVGNGSLGVNAKIMQSTLASEFKANAVAIDLGALFKIAEIHPGADLFFGLAAQNLGNTIRYQDAAEPLPRTIRAGVSYAVLWNIRHQLQAEFDVIQSNDSDDLNENIGFEYWYSRTFAVRTGYKINRDISDLSFGLGFDLKPIGLDYALTLQNDLGPSHKISLNWKF